MVCLHGLQATHECSLHIFHSNIKRIGCVIEGARNIKITRCILHNLLPYIFKDDMLKTHT